MRSKTVKPVKPYSRFPKSKIADTGVNPQSGFVEFTKKDPVLALNAHRDHELTVKDQIYVKIPIGQVPYGTTKHTYKLGLDTEARLKREELGIITKEFPRNPTDVISAKPPPRERTF